MHQSAAILLASVSLGLPSAATLHALCAGLGFEDCSAQVTMLAEQDVTSKKAYVKEHEHIKTRGWAYYAFNVTDEDYQLVVNVAEEEDSACKLLKLSNAPHIRDHTFSCCQSQTMPGHTSCSA